MRDLKSTLATSEHYVLCFEIFYNLIAKKRCIILTKKKKLNTLA